MAKSESGIGGLIPWPGPDPARKAREGAPENPTHGALDQLPREHPVAPEEGPAFFGRPLRKVCSWCGREVAPGDPGRTTHVTCEACRPAAHRRTREAIGLVLDCRGCGAGLPIAGRCERCGVSNGGPARPEEWLLDDEGRPRAQRSAAREHEATAFLTSLGLWPLPGGVLIVLLVPTALVWAGFAQAVAR